MLDTILGTLWWGQTLTKVFAFAMSCHQQCNSLIRGGGQGGLGCGDKVGGIGDGGGGIGDGGAESGMEGAESGVEGAGIGV